MNGGPPRAMVLTARGRGAVAVIDVRGPGALDAVAAVLEAGPGSLAACDRPLLRRLGGVTGEEVVVVAGPLVEADHEVVELHCHGGTAVVAWVLDRLRARGVVAPDSGSEELTVAGDHGLLRGQAWALLPQAPTARTAEALLEQAAGALDDELDAIGTLLAPAPEEARRIRTLLERSALGLRLVTGHTVVLAGPPNVGKSSLFNAIVGFERAIVSPTAGTTRDALRARLALRGWPVELIDTAGLHEAFAELDRESVARSQSVLTGADLVLRVVDLSRPFETTDLPGMAPPDRVMVVANKADLAAAWDPVERGAIAVSAATGAGIGGLIDAILGRLGVSPECLQGPLAFLSSQVELLSQALAAAEAGEPAEAGRILEALRGLRTSADPRRERGGPYGHSPGDRVS